MTNTENLLTQEWKEFNAKLQERVETCYNSDEFKAWLNALDDKCKRCPVADGRFSKDELTRRRSLTCCECNCPKVLVQTYWDEHGVDILGRPCNDYIKRT